MLSSFFGLEINALNVRNIFFFKLHDNNRLFTKSSRSLNRDPICFMTTTTERASCYKLLFEASSNFIGTAILRYFFLIGGLL